MRERPLAAFLLLIFLLCDVYIQTEWNDARKEYCIKILPETAGENDLFD